jgi:hypothetical protein
MKEPVPPPAACGEEAQPILGEVRSRALPTSSCTCRDIQRSSSISHSRTVPAQSPHGPAWCPQSIRTMPFGVTRCHMVPTRCPHGAHTVPRQCPHDATWCPHEAHTFPMGCHTMLHGAYTVPAQCQHSAHKVLHGNTQRNMVPHRTLSTRCHSVPNRAHTVQHIFQGATRRQTILGDVYSVPNSATCRRTVPRRSLTLPHKRCPCSVHMVPYVPNSAT